MKIILLAICCSLYLNNGFGQKPALDYSVVSNFPEMISWEISNNGKFVLYVVNNKKAGSSLVIRATDSHFKKEISGPSGFFLDAHLTFDSRRVIFMRPGDSLCIIELANNRELNIPNCTSFKLPGEGSGEWIAYELRNNELVLRNLLTGAKKQYPKINEYWFSDSGKVLLVKHASASDSSINILKWISLPSTETTSIWQGKEAGNFVFDHSETKIAFVAVNDYDESNDNIICYYQQGMDSARSCVTRQTTGMEKSFAIRNDWLKFSSDGQRIFFHIYQTQAGQKMDLKFPSVDIWNSKDQFLQPEQSGSTAMNNSRSYAAVTGINGNKVIRLEYENDKISFYPNLNNGGNNDYLLTATNVNLWEGYRSYSVSDIYLVSTKDGTRKCIKRQLPAHYYYFSPGGKYVYWYDVENKDYFTYEIQTGATKNISINIGVPPFDEQWDMPSPPPPYGAAVWLKDDEAILIHDRYDVWKVDPAGMKPPVNFTNGYGRKNKIMLRYASTDPYGIPLPAVNKDETIIFCALNESNKENGFFRKPLNKTGDPLELIMSPSVFYFPSIRFVELSTYLVKAKQANVYLLKRMSATEYPNLQVTKDFINFQAISELSPQKSYNWLTSELVHWTAFDGHPAAGILYKPENFDPQKKYPIIFTLYERYSDGLNVFLQPELSTGPMNIPFFVSQGYLVFCPDIHYTKGVPGESVYNYVVSAAKVMSQKSWVNAEKMGIQGHSFGGYEVNWLITRTGLFAAAASSAGISNLVSQYGALMANHLDAHNFVEQFQPRMGATLWKDQAGYIKNSPLFSADKATTPLLMVHNKQDLNVPWSQSVEFFTALRRLGKRTWMLQYDNEGHTLLDGNNKLDYSIRLCEFFDHYLKDKPVAVWMK